MRFAIVLTATLFGATAPGCNPYDPSLPDVPFRCGTEEPRCPDSYTCVEHSASQQLCERENADNAPDAGVGPDGSSSFVCNDDSEIERNDSISDPTITPIPTLDDKYELAGLAICPDTDIDVFRFSIDQTGKNVRVEITFNAGNGELLLDVLNSTGVSIRSGSPVTGDAGLVRAEVANLPAGTYYAQVRAPAGTENNYGIFIQTTGP